MMYKLVGLPSGLPCVVCVFWRRGSSDGLAARPVVAGTAAGWGTGHSSGVRWQGWGWFSGRYAAGKSQGGSASTCCGWSDPLICCSRQTHQPAASPLWCLFLLLQTTMKFEKIPGRRHKALRALVWKLLADAKLLWVLTFPARLEGD